MTSTGGLFRSEFGFVPGQTKIRPAADYISLAVAPTDSACHRVLNANHAVTELIEFGDSGTVTAIAVVIPLNM